MLQSTGSFVSQTSLQQARFYLTPNTFTHKYNEFTYTVLSVCHIHSSPQMCSNVLKFNNMFTLAQINKYTPSRPKHT